MHRSLFLGAAASIFLGAAAQAQAQVQVRGYVQGLDDLSHYVFAPNRASADIAVIDTDTDTVAARIPVGSVPHQVAVSETLMRLVASNTADDTVSVVNLRDFRTVATIQLDHEPEHMEIGPDGDTLAVGNIGAGTVSLVSLSQARELRRVDGLYEPHNLTFSPSGAFIYVGNLGAGVVSVIDVARGEVIEEIPVGAPQTVASGAQGDGFQGVINVTATPDGRLGFAAFGEGDSMAVLDLRTRELIGTLGLGEMPWRAYTTADGRLMITPNNGDGTVSIVSVHELRELKRLRGAEDMTGVNADIYGTTAFVVSRGEDKLVVIDLETLERAGEIELGEGASPETGVVTPDGSKYYVALSGTNEIAVIDVASRRLVKRIGDVGQEPWGAHMAGAINYCH